MSFALSSQGSRDTPDVARGVAGQDPRRLGRPDDRRLLRRADRVQVQRQNLRRRPDLDARTMLSNAHRPGRSLRRDDVRQGDGRPSGSNATCEQYGEAFKDSKYHLWHANAGARRALEPGHQGALVRPSQIQLPRQRHRFPDRGGLHRPDVPGPAARVEQILRPRRAA